ncbi:MAG: dynamin family protein [gamma proteobacterium symbiont of Bathyaustriella thionipta]|nr:dynamin family protein [gamma proteobacterium symbiont of Bathyaustriella thionipta]MCU7951031.1 dynamin family protein [gamma proteobacterium symbiont of Bathyaustriella thionipta]MCU7953511.1 dynamin family protein [gamma proteobacterium symbiont of Bathyaustriella thionipta]MCU7957537.1 dynamin family protein [gamma proteobacterium symbiont of Bathyaustriella thionipta]MCU7969012.1 dynamin family protein [gamma proteobacterium symbiont of Bathyaustriella thionipta]
MTNENSFDSIHAYGKWKSNLVQAIEEFQGWLDSTELEESEQSLKIYETLQTLKHDRITLAFVGEFSRGKTELINAIFFSQFKRRLLPSEAGRTTMCPTELFYDIDEPKPYMRLLPIESRTEDASITEQKQDSVNWTHIQLDISSPENMASSFAQITNTKKVKASEAKRLGLYDVITDNNGTELADSQIVEIPMWRHALINFPHPFLEQGLAILDTPGLNSLGNEPELTINMLPNAQAAIFVLAADTGVTRSDMDIWRRHLKSFRRNHHNGLVIALNKIDTLWDDLKTDSEIKSSIQRQCAETAHTLSIDAKRVFAVSAQKGLIGRVRDNAKLIKASNLNAMENVLSNEILPQKEQLVRNTLITDINEMMQESKSILLGQFNSKKKSIQDFSGVGGKNENIIQVLLEKTRKEQAIYHNNAENLQSSRQILSGQHNRLKRIINLDQLDKQVSDARKLMQGSWTTTGMKKSMKSLFDNISSTMNEAAKQTELTNRLVKSIFNRFQNENEDTDIKPKLFSIASYKQEIDTLYQDAEEYRTSVYSTMTEQSFVIKKFFISLVSRARNIYYQLNKDADDWGKRALTPLIRQVKGHKKELHLRLDQLKKAGQSRDSISERITSLKIEAKGLQKHIFDVNKMLTTINTPMPAIVHKKKMPDNVTAIRG